MKLQPLKLHLTLLAAIVIGISACENGFVAKILPSRSQAEAETPLIVSHPQDAVYEAGETARALSVTVSVVYRGNLSYQWYVSSQNSSSGGTAVSQDSEYTPPTDKRGTVYYYVVVTNTYSGKTASAVSNTAALRIGVVTVSIGGLSVANKVYDGTAQAAVSGTPVINGVIAGDAVSVVAGTASFSDRLAGSGKTATFSGWSLEGKDAGGYYLREQPADVTADIIPKTLTISGLTVMDKAYDGRTTAVVGGFPVLNGVVEGDTVTVAGGTAEFETAVFGADKPVIFSGWSLTGPSAGNYVVEQPSGLTAKIELFNMIAINAGSFMMGSPEGEIGRSANESPLHQVTLSAFFMSKYEVMQDQYRTIMGNNPAQFTAPVPLEAGTPDTLPVEWVSWYDTLVFCNKLSVAEGLIPAYRISGSADPADWGPVPSAANAVWDAVEIAAGATGYRLPTEAQWEYACRAGMTTAYNMGNTFTSDTGWYQYNSDMNTHGAGLKPNNGWGLCDMHGNTAEWCWDWYDPAYYAASPPDDPHGPASGTGRIYRGGCWRDNNPAELRSARRSVNNPWARNNILGFRIVRPQ